MKNLVRALIAAACLQLLASCGGGVSSDNASSEIFFTLQPDTAEAYSGVEIVFTIAGGQPPYTVSSSNALIAPVASPNVSTKSFSIVPQFTNAIVPVVITVIDRVGGRVESTLRVNPNIISNTLTITPQASVPGQPGTISCGSSVCSGGYATVLVTLTSATQSVANRAVRFDVEQGSFGFLPNSFSTVTVSSYSTTTDFNGHAQALLRADAFAPSQIALLRATDLATGSVLRASFSIVRVTDGSTVLSVLPATAKITGTLKGICSDGVSVDYLVAGGAPPYAVGSSIDAVASLLQVSVPSDGGRFTARTHGGCGTTIFTITDAMGRTATASLENAEGETEALPVSVLPTTATMSCGETSAFTISGGISPFVVSSTSSFVRATVSGRVITATRLAGTIAPSGPADVTVSLAVGDGTTGASVTLTVKNVCP